MIKDMNEINEQVEEIDSDCLEAFDHVYAYINNEIKDPKIIAKIEHHLSHCKSCYSRAQMERKIDDRIKETAEDAVPEKLQDRIQNLLNDF